MSALIKDIIASSLPAEKPLLNFFAKRGGCNVMYLTRVKKRGSEGESYALMGLSLGSFALNNEAHKQNRHSSTFIHLSGTERPN